jgi:DNA polymerase-3 subunit gamma/tau
MGMAPMQAVSPAESAVLPASAEEVHALLLRESPLLAQQFHDYAVIVRLDSDILTITRHVRLPASFAADLGAALFKRTGQRWTVSLVADQGAPSLFERAAAEEDAARAAILESPLVKAAFQAFPDAELIDYSAPEPRSLAS